MFRRAWRVLRAQGPLEFARRGAGWLARRFEEERAARRRSLAARRAQRLPQSPEPIRFDPADEPLVSIVVPVYDGWAYTNACLRALRDAWDPSIPAEVVVVDDGSTDRTAELLSACGGLRVVRLDRNAGFAQACNAGARNARGALIHFLNNDACVTEGWLRPLVASMQGDERIAASASQLRFFDDRIAEAGAVVWRDGRASNYGRGGDPADWRYRSVRDADYGSAASLMVRADDFHAAGGFSDAYAPAYYEDADLCFALRARGRRVVYQPASIVYHAEGATLGSNRNAQAAALQERSRQAFVRRWERTLLAHFAPDPSALDLAARRLCAPRTVVVADEHVPFTDRDAGSRRIDFLLDVFAGRDWHVVFAATDPGEYPPHAERMRARGVEVVLGATPEALATLACSVPPVELLWLCRPQPAGLLAPAASALGVPWVFDTVDLHYLRLQREERIEKHPTAWEAMRRQELELARAAALTVVTSQAERTELEGQGIERVAVVSVIEPAAKDEPPGYDDRAGILFVGNYAHAPNADAARWLATEIFPRVRARAQGIALTLAGADPTRAVRALASEGIDVPGYVGDLDPLVRRARVFAAPLRYGAGVKGKIVYALAHGIPVVTTPLGAEGIFAEGDRQAIAQTPEALAEAILHLYQDRTAWESAARRGRELARRFSPETAAHDVDAALTRLRFA